MPPRDAQPVHRHDDRFAAFLDGDDGILIRSHDFAPAFRCLGQIHASSKGPFARSGKNHGPHAVVCIDLQNLVMERSAHFGGQRIELFGPIQREYDDAAFLFDQNCVAHDRCLPASTSVRSVGDRVGL